MANRKNSIQEKIQEALEKLDQALDHWLTRQGLKSQPVPIPIDRPLPRKRR